MMNMEAFLNTLPIMGLCMAGIFIVMAAVALAVGLLKKVFK